MSGPRGFFVDGSTARSALARLRIAVAARGRRLNHDRFARADRCRIAACEPLHAAVSAPHPVLADLAGLAAREPERAHAAVAGQDGAIHLLQESDRAPYAGAGVPLPASARARSGVEVFRQHRAAELPRVGIRYTCTGDI